MANNIDTQFIYYEKTLSTALKENNKHKIINAYRNLGKLSVKSGTNLIALTYYRSALSWCDTLQDWKLLSDIYTDIGHAYFESLMYYDAAENYYNALQINKNGTTVSTIPGYLYSNLGIVMGHIGNANQAHEYFKKAIAYAESQKDSSMLANILNNTGVALAQNGQIEKGSFYFDSSIRIYRNLNAKASKALHNSLINLANVYLDRKDQDYALRLLYEAQNIAQKLQPDYPLKYNASLIIAQALVAKKEYSSASSYLSIVENDSNIPLKNRLTWIEVQADLLSATGKHAKANDLLRQYMKLNDSIKGKEIAIKVSELEAQYRSVEKDKQLANNKLILMERDKLLTTQRLWMYLIGSVSILLLALILGYFWFRRKRTISDMEIQRLRGIIEGEENERKRLSHELHDGVNSQLAVARMLIQKMAINYTQDYDTLDKMSRVIDSTDKEVRKVAHNLAPDDLLERGLTSAIANYCEELFSESHILSDIQVYGIFDALSVSLQLNIYRIVQELTHNIVKHAEATQVTLLLYKEGKEIILIIDDNGNGISDKNNFSGIGLTSIQKRVKVYSGSFQIDSSPDKGTHIQIKLQIP